MKIILVAGARPNFMKIASIIDGIRVYNRLSDLPIDARIVHTGQHYGEQMSFAFFKDLGLPQPDIDLEVGSSSHAHQTAEIMKRFEPVLLKERPDVVLVVGDVNSTVACCLVASKIDYHTPNSELRTPNSRRKPLIAHVEAGLRSFDRSMPEETNRILTDQLSDFLFVSEPSGLKNLKDEGFKNFLRETDTKKIRYDSPLKIHHSLPLVAFVGNTMIDTLLKHRKLAQHSNILERLCLKDPVLNPQPANWRNSSVSALQPQTSNLHPYAILTLHRPSNVDDRELFMEILEALSVIAEKIPIFFPVHPRTLNRIKEFGFETFFSSLTQRSEVNTLDSHSPQSSTLGPHQGSICCIEPLGYLDFLCLMSNARLVLTDSGGIQEEATVLGIPCVTLRENTERPITITHGTNVLTGIEKEQIIKLSFLQLEKYNKGTSSSPRSSSLSPQAVAPPLWDGHAGERIVKILASRIP